MGKSDFNLWEFIYKMGGKTAVDIDWFIEKAKKEGDSVEFEGFTRFLLFSGWGREIAPTPRILSQFICQYLSIMEVESILDPWANIGHLLDAVTDCCKSRKSVGIIPNQEHYEFATKISKLKNIEWINGDPLKILSEHKKTYDVVISFPPVNRESQKEEIEVGDEKVEIYDAAERLLLLKSANLLKKEGKAFFVVSNSFFLDKKRSVFSNLSKFNLYIDSILHLPSGMFSPLTSIPLALVLICRKKPDDLFVAELSPDKNVETIVTNLRLRREGKIDPLGMLVKANEFSYYDQLISKRELKRQAIRHKLKEYKISELTTSVNLANKKYENGFEEQSNSIYLPLIGKSDAITNIADFRLKPHNYIQLVVKPEIAMADYLVTLLSSEFGLLLRRSITSGAYIPKISKNSVLGMSFFIPNISTQQQVINLQGRVENVYSRVSSIYKQFRKNPLRIPDIEKEIKPFIKLDSFESWVDELPFPLASILMAYHAEEEMYYKRSHLFHFFEALAQFNSTVMLSAYFSDEKFYVTNKNQWIDKDDKYSDYFETASFGSWIILAERLGKFTRRLLSKGSDERETCLSLFKTRAISFVESLANKDLYKNLRVILDLRNRMKGHGGIESPKSIKRDLTQLDLILSKVRDVISNYEGIRLILPGPGEYSEGIYHYKVQDLMGSRTIFKKLFYETTAPMDVNNLYLLDVNYKAPLELVPFVRFMESPHHEKNACYFYNRLDKKGIRWISYHFTDEQEIYLSDPQVVKALELLRPKQQSFIK